MPWWDSLDSQAANQNEATQYFQRLQAQLAAAQRAQQVRAQQEEQANQENDSRGLFGFLGGAGQKAIQAGGNLIGEAVSKGMEGLDWYDDNVVKNVWDNVTGPATMGALGRQYNPDEDAYDKLTGWQKLAAGTVSDPLNYVPVAGASSKVLKASAAGTRMARAAEVADRGVQAADRLVNLPFEAAGKGVGLGLKVGVGLPARGIGHALRTTEMGSDILRTLGRPTTAFLVNQDSNLARASGLHIISQEAQKLGISPEAIDGPTANSILQQTVKKVGDYNQAARDAVRITDPAKQAAELTRLNAMAPTTAERMVYDSLTGGPGYRGVSKRLWENFRRMATESGKATGSNDLDFVEDIIRATAQGDIRPDIAAGTLASHAGNDELAGQILMGTVDKKSKQYKDLVGWVTNWTKARPLGIAERFSMTPDALQTANGLDVINHLGEAVGRQTKLELDSATTAARAYMDHVRFGPIEVQAGALLNQTFDPFYKTWWTDRIERFLINPFQQLVLGYALFPFSNAMEEVMQNMVGGNMNYRKWSMSTDEFLNLYRRMGPEFELPSSLVDGIENGTDAAHLFGAEAADDRTFSLQGGRPEGGRFNLPDRGIKGALTGGSWLRLSNVWSGNARRGYVMSQFLQNMEGELRQVFDVGTTEKILRQYGFYDRFNTEMRMGAILHAQGHSPEEVGQLLRANLTGPHQDTKQLLGIVNSAGFHPRAQNYLRNNVGKLADPATRDEALAQAFKLQAEDATVFNENMTDIVGNYVDGILDDIDQTAPDDLAGHLASLEDARQVMDRTIEHSRTMASRWGRMGEDVEHKFNAERLDELEERFNGFNDKYQQATRAIAKKLGKDLTPEGKKALSSLGDAVAKRGQLLQQRARKLRTVNTTFARNRKFSELTPTEVTAWHDARDAVYEEFRPKLDDLDRKIRKVGTPQNTWMPAGKTAQQAQEVADHLVREAGVPKEEADQVTKQLALAIADGKDPYQALMDIPVQGFPGHEYSFPGDSGEQLNLFEDGAVNDLPGTVPPGPPPDPKPYNNIVDQMRQRIQGVGNVPQPAAPAVRAGQGDLTSAGKAHPLLSGNPGKPSPASLIWMAKQDKALQGRASEIMGIILKEGDDVPADYSRRWVDALQQAYDEFTNIGKDQRIRNEMERVIPSTEGGEIDLSRYTNNRTEDIGKPTGQIDLQEVSPGNLPDTSLRNEPMSSRKATPEERKTWSRGLTARNKGKAIGGVQPLDEDPFVYTKTESGRIEKHLRSDMEFDSAELRQTHGQSSFTGEASEEEYGSQLLAEFEEKSAKGQERMEQKLSEHDLRLLRDAQERARLELPDYGAASRSEDQELRDRALNRSRPAELTPEQRSASADELMRRHGESGSFGPENRYSDDMGMQPGALGYHTDADLTGSLDDPIYMEYRARSMAKSAGIPVEQAREVLYEEQAIAKLFADKEKSQEFLARMGSIFRGTGSAPLADMLPHYEELAKNFREFVHTIDSAAEMPGLSQELDEALNKAIDGYVKNLRKVDPAQTRPVLQNAWDQALNKYHKFFTNYDDGKTIHHVMRHVFPFWRYEYQRFPRIARSIQRAPWLLTNYHRFVKGSGDGTINLPGNIRLNPLGGTMYTAMRNLLKDGGYSFNSHGGFWQQANELMGTTGFIPGPPVGILDAVKSGTPGDQIPTGLRLPLEAARGYGAEVPGGQGLSTFAGDVLDTFPSRFRDYAINQELAAQGIHPYQATPEQRKAAEEAASRASVLQSASGGMVQTNNRFAYDKTQEQIQAALAAGIPEDVVRDAQRKHANPLYATKPDGTRYLNTAQLRAINEQHPDWERLAAVRSSFLSPNEQIQEGDKWKARETIKEMEAQAQESLKPIYEAFARGEVTGKQLLDARGRVLDELRGAKKAHNLQYAETDQPERDVSNLPREDQLAQAFYDIEPPTLPNGLPDWDTADRLKAQFLRDNHVTADEQRYITEQYPRNRFNDPLMSGIEDEYQTASKQRKDYYSLPKYPGLSDAQQELADKGIALISQIRAGRPNLTTAQALAILARYDSSVAQATRKALTIKSKQSSATRKGIVNERTNPRKVFWDSHPLLDKFYGEGV